MRMQWAAPMPAPMCWALRGPPGPSDGGPAAPAHRGGAWLSGLLDCWIGFTTFLGMVLFEIRNVMFVNIVQHFKSRVTRKSVEL